MTEQARTRTTQSRAARPQGAHRWADRFICLATLALALLAARPGVVGAAVPATAPGEPSREEAAAALRRATEFFRVHVATEGGYLWRYSEDMKLREGEGKATDTQVWVQPPGTPEVGMAYMEAYQATGEQTYLDAATETATCLVRGQLKSGGWEYLIEFDKAKRRRWAYRIDARGRGNYTRLDDDTTQSALRLLMRVDAALKFKNAPIHEAAMYALTKLLAAQYPNGAWPQVFRKTLNPEKFPVKRAGFPETWSRDWQRKNYHGYYTLNDLVIDDMIETMLEAAETYREDKYRAAALKAGEFILLAQMPEPQPGWAQQYDFDMHPAWAREFEPPAVTGGESQPVMMTLLNLYRRTGQKRFLEPIPRALAYYERSKLPDGRLARFYELRTNKPLYITHDDPLKLTYSDKYVKRGYNFKVPSRLAEIRSEYKRLRLLSPEQLKALPTPQSVRARLRVVTPPELLKALTPASRTPQQQAERARAAIAALDEKGRWVETGKLNYHRNYKGRFIDCATFIRNVRALSRFLAATGTDAPPHGAQGLGTGPGARTPRP